VLLSTPLHASSNFTVSVQLANKRGLKTPSSQPFRLYREEQLVVASMWNVFNILALQ
jgi:hypothetical protein